MLIQTEENSSSKGLKTVALVLSQLAKAPDVTAGNDDYACFRLVGIEEPEAHLQHLGDLGVSVVPGDMQES